jgi:thioesterase domain-containing protein
MGGLIALEMARQLQGQQHEVGLVALMDSWAFNPLSVPEHLLTEVSSTGFVQDFVQDLFGLQEQTSEELFARLQSLETEEEQLHFIAEQAKQLDVLPPDADHTQIARLLQVFKANSYAARIYVPQDCTHPLLLCYAEEGPEGERKADWLDLHNLMSGERERYIVPGNHYTMLAQPRVQLVAERLKARLDTIQQRLCQN